jgi:hypothetical protein
VGVLIGGYGIEIFPVLPYCVSSLFENQVADARHEDTPTELLNAIQSVVRSVVRLSAISTMTSQAKSRT